MEKQPAIENNESISISENVLSRIDTVILEYTGHKLYKYLEGINEMPGAIVFPDLSARPLCYLVKPMLEKICKERGVEMPKLVFFMTFRSPEVQDWEPSKNSNRDEYEKRLTAAKNARKEISYSYTSPTDSRGRNIDDQIRDNKIKKQNLADKRADLSRVGGWTKKRKERLSEILERVKNNKILIIDDVLSSYETFDQVEELKKELDFDVNYFALVDARDLEHERDVDYRDKISIGLRDTDNRLRLTAGWAYNGFSFGNRGSTPFSADPNQSEYTKHRVIGLEKTIIPDKYPKISDEKDFESMKKLRKEVNNIGVKIISDGYEPDDENHFKKLPLDVGDF